MFKLAGADLRDFDAGDERQNHVCRKALFKMGLDTNGVCSVHEDAGVLRGDDRLDDGGKVVHIGQGLHAQNDIVVRIFSGGCFFWGTDDCRTGRQISNCTRCLQL